MSAILAAFLRRIPQSNQNALPIEQIANDEDTKLLRGYVLMLQTIGVVNLNENDSVQASSQTAKYMLESLASFVESGQTLVGDWQTRGVYRDSTSGALQNAPTFLHEMEKRRISILDSPPPVRNEEVAQVLIKRSNPTTGQSEFLLQYDTNADQYQLIGGRRKISDKTLEATIIREIEEELIDGLQLQRDYGLVLVAENLTPKPILSPTFGALSEYHFWIFHMRDLSQALSLHKNDQWVPIDDVLHGRVVKNNGETVLSTNNAIYKLINESIEGGLAGLEDSFSI
jgi:8-oxo-dGTP pyrophosphatase MutT (NUDIX family)